MPLVVPAALTTPDVAIVVPENGGRVVVLVDPRVSPTFAAETVDRVREIMHGPGDVLARLADLVHGRPYAVG